MPRRVLMSRVGTCAMGVFVLLTGLIIGARVTPIRDAHAWLSPTSTGPGVRRALLADRRFQLAFIRGHRRGGTTSLVVATRRGRPERVLLRTGKRVTDFNWTEGGTSLLFEAVGYHRFEIRRDGSWGAAGASAPSCMSAPDPAADGSSLECTDYGGDLDLRRAGSVTHLFTEGDNTFYDGAPGFSRDGSRVVIAAGYSVDPPSYFLRVYLTVPLSAHGILFCGSPLDPVGECHAPVWSPDRKHIAFWSTRQAPRAGAVFVVNANGSRLRRISLRARHPAWSPDGRLIAFDKLVAGRRQIVVARPDGTRARIVTRGSIGSWRPRWRTRSG